MNKTKLFTVLALAAANLTWAQRSVDMQATLEAPLNGSTWQNASEVPFTVTLTNNGPDNLVIGDTLFFMPNVSGIGILPVILQEEIANGATVEVFNDVLALEAPSTPFTADLCVTVLDPNTAGLTIGGVPVLVTYDDGDTTNNTSCATITLVDDADTGSAIRDVQLAKEQLVMYPNPANDQIYFTVGVDQSVAATVSVADMMGRVVKTQEVLVTGKQTELSLNVADLPTGTYFISLTAGDRVFVGKATIQR